jgi:hypothetical protein
MMRTALMSILTALVVALGCSANGSGTAGNGCQVCNGGCKNGLVTVCLGLLPPGCGSQSSTQFCPYGCAPDASGGCHFYPEDGAVPSGCAASSATIVQGALSGAGSDARAATSFLATETRVVVATTANAACASTVDAGVAPPSGSGAALTMSLLMNFAGQVAIGAGVRAQLTTWKNGAFVINNQSATAGTVSLNLNQPSGGTMGSYDLMFTADEEMGRDPESPDNWNYTEVTVAKPSASAPTLCAARSGTATFSWRKAVTAHDLGCRYLAI